MRYSVVKYSLLGIALAVLMGCASGNRNIALQDNFWKNQNKKITVASFKAPQPQVHQVGGQGLLDMAITSVANKSINNKLKQTDLGWYNEMPQEFANQLKNKHIQAAVLSRKLEAKQKNYSSELAETNGDLLLTLELKAIGARREYAAGFIPQGAPEAYCVLVGELIDPKDKKVLWHHETEVLQKVQGAWDQPPAFPNFTAAHNIAVAEAKQELLDSFFSGH